jgi:purine nucleoside permease
MILAASVFAAGGKEKPIEIKALILPKFEVGELSGDFPGEAQYYYEHYFASPNFKSFIIKNTPEPLYVNNDGVALIVTLMGKAQSGQTVTAVLADSRFDFSNALIVSTGCAGSPPERTVLGDVILAGIVIDHELGHGNAREDVGSTGPLFVRDTGYDFGGITTINDALLQWAFKLVQNIELKATERSTEVTGLYGFQDRPPRVQIGGVLTGDNYWAGKASRLLVEEVFAAYDSPYPYMITEMEDAAIGVAVKRAGLENNYIVIRDSVDYDTPLPDNTILEFWEETSKDGKSFDWGIFAAARENNFKVGQVIIDNWLTR